VLPAGSAVIKPVIPRVGNALKRWCEVSQRSGVRGNCLIVLGGSGSVAVKLDGVQLVSRAVCCGVAEVDFVVRLKAR
jgi:hypothetical protein